MITAGEGAPPGWEASVNSDAFPQLEAGAAIVVYLAYAFIGMVGSLSDVDSYGMKVGGKGILEVVVGIGPGGAVVIS